MGYPCGQDKKRLKGCSTTVRAMLEYAGRILENVPYM